MLERLRFQTMKLYFKYSLSLYLAFCILALAPTFAYCKQILTCQMEMDCCDHADVSGDQIKETPCCGNSSHSSKAEIVIFSNNSQEIKNTTYLSLQALPVKWEDPYTFKNFFKHFKQSNTSPPFSNLLSRNLPLLC